MTPVLDLLSNPDHWTTKAYARDNNKKIVDDQSPFASCWCIVGAIRKCYPTQERFEVLDKLNQHCCPNPIDFNDNCTHEELIDVLKKAQI